MADPHAGSADHADHATTHAGRQALDAQTPSLWTTARPETGRLLLRVARTWEAQQQATLLRSIAAHVGTSYETLPNPTPTGTAGGDPRQLRGIPTIGGCQGAIPGTTPGD